MVPTVSQLLALVSLTSYQWFPSQHLYAGWDYAVLDKQSPQLSMNNGNNCTLDFGIE